jgi:hypothetical protein
MSVAVSSAARIIICSVSPVSSAVVDASGIMAVVDFLATAPSCTAVFDSDRL